MVNYRRARVPGATFFFTVTLNDRKSDLLTRRTDLLRAAFRTVRHQNPFQIDAIVVLPDHLHTMWTLPTDDADFSSRWQALKAQNARGEYDLWQRRYWEHLIRNDEDFERHVNYIHYNPVKHFLVKHPSDW